MPTKTDNDYNKPAYTNIDADNALLSGDSRKQTKLHNSNEENAKENPLENLPIVGFLVSFSATERGEYWILREGNKNTIGSDPDCAIRLNEAKVSSKHAIITARKHGNTGKLMVGIRDTDSMNGVLVNGSDIGLFENCECFNNDKITIGNYELLLMLIDKELHGLGKNEKFEPNAATLEMPPFDYSNRDNYSSGTHS